MPASQIVKVRRIAAAAAITASVLCGRARAQVLDQTPSDSVAVFKIKNLADLNSKVAKMAKTFGLDEISPESKDPLGAMLEKAHMTKGVNKDGEAAIAIFSKLETEKAEEPQALALVPVSSYDEFLGNFKKKETQPGGDVTAVEDTDDAKKTLYIAHHGAYAAMSDAESRLSVKELGIKLSGAAAKESDAKDAVFFLNIPQIRERALPEIKAHRNEWIDDINKELAKEKQLKEFVPVFKAVVNEALDVAENTLTQSDAALFSMNLSDQGLTGSWLLSFKPDSKYGQTVAKLKAGDTQLLTGLPDVKYFVFAGSALDPKVVEQIADDTLDPIIKELNDTNDAGKKIAETLESSKAVLGKISHSAVGIAAPTKALGQESLLQEIVVANGDSKAIVAAEKKNIAGAGDLMGLLPQNGGAKVKIELGEPKTIDGVELQTYATKFTFDDNDPKGMQAQQMIGLMYGPNGLTGTYGAVNDNTFVMAQGASDELLKELIASAKSGKDVLDDRETVKSVTKELPKNPAVVYYIALDNIISTAVRYAQGFGLPIKVKLPQDLAPIGVSLGAEGATLRVDAFVPAQTVQSLIAAGIQAYTNVQGGAPKGGGL